MILFTKSTKALIFKINNSEQKIKNSKDNKGPKTKTKLNKPSLNFTWSKIPWKNNVPSSKWKKNSFNKKLTDIKNAVILFNLKTEKFDNLTLKFLLIIKIFNPNSNKSANKWTCFNKQITIIPRKFKNCSFKILKKINLLVIITNGFLKNLTWKIKLLFLKTQWIKIKNFMMLCWLLSKNLFHVMKRTPMKSLFKQIKTWT